jgi:hypothetical protein
MKHSNMSAARILAIHAHPGDIEILAGGTVALLAHRRLPGFHGALGPGARPIRPVSYGEGFPQYTGHPYPRSPLLRQLLRTRVIQ